VEGRFLIAVVTVTCAQMLLNLRTAVYHVPDYVTTYYLQQCVVVDVNGTINSPHRPGTDTLIYFWWYPKRARTRAPQFLH